MLIHMYKEQVLNDMKHNILFWRNICAGSSTIWWLKDYQKTSSRSDRSLIKFDPKTFRYFWLNNTLCGYTLHCITKCDHTKVYYNQWSITMNHNLSSLIYLKIGTFLKMKLLIYLKVNIMFQVIIMFDKITPCLICHLTAKSGMSCFCLLFAVRE